MMKASPKSHTKRLTVGAMLSAIGVILLGIGSVFQSLDLTTAALASVLCIYAVIELGGGYPWMVWGVTSLLALLLLPPPKSPAVLYLLIGFYPMIKEKLEKLPRPITLLLKLVVLHVLLALVCFALQILFPNEVLPQIGWMLIPFYLLGVAAFLMFDYALSKLITYYLRHLRHRLGLK